MAERPPPHGALAHVAINANDLAASRRFYTELFGWRFAPWGPPGFFKIEKPNAPHVIAALQQRRELIEGKPTIGFECTIAVDDVAATARAAIEFGGRVLMEPVTIPTVCELAFLEDPAGNVVGIANYTIR